METWSAPLAWLYLVIGIALYVIIYDLTARARGQILMTTQFREWLYNPAVGPFIWAIWVGTFAGLTWHWLVRHK